MLTFSRLVTELKTAGDRRRIALAAAVDENSIEALWEARELVDATLFGEETAIRAILAGQEIPADHFTIVNVPGDPEAGLAAAAAVRAGECNMLMKGKLSTGDFLKSVLHKEKGLRKGGLLSHVMAAEFKNTLIFVTDGGMNIHPTVDELVQITRNGLDVAFAAGIENPTAALLSAQVESYSVPETEHIALELSQRFLSEGFPYIFEGALALDDMFYLDSLPDVIVVRSIEAGNLLGKSLIYFHGMESAGLIAGAAAPVIMLSRADDSATKRNSIALAAKVAG